MKLRGIMFDNVFFAPGTFGYFGETRRLYRSMYKTKSVFISKTVTVTKYESQSESPKSIFGFLKNTNRVKKLGAGVVLERSSFSNPGIEYFFKNKKWQNLERPFLISIAFTSDSHEGRLQEARTFVEVIASRTQEFTVPFGLLICFPDAVDGEYDIYQNEIIEILRILYTLGVPIVTQVSLSFPPDIAGAISSSQYCDALVLRGSILWDTMQQDAKKVFFQTETSPVKEIGGGFVYGKYMAPLAAEWARQAKNHIRGKPFIVGGGILNSKDVKNLVEMGAHAIMLDQAIFLRPLHINGIFKKAKELLYRTRT